MFILTILISLSLESFMFVNYALKMEKAMVLYTDWPVETLVVYVYGQRLTIGVCLHSKGLTT